jgi:hypothetical protein
MAGMSDTAQKRDVLEALRSLLAHRTKDLGCYEFVLEAWIESAADEIERLRDARRWIPVSERLPEEGQPVLGCWRLSQWKDEMPSMVTSMWYEAGGFFDDNENRERTPTHWMPLPEPPEVK